MTFNPDYNPFDPPTREAEGRQTQTFNGGYTPNRFVPKQPAYEEPSRRWDNFFDSDNNTSELSRPENPSTPSFAAISGGICMQIQNRWIATPMSSGLLIIDQQHAHERILYEHLMERPQNAGAQQMLFPVNCTFSAADAELFNEMLPDLQQRGFEVSNLGKCTFVVTATPPEIKGQDLQSLFDQMLADQKNSMLQKFGDRDQNLCRSLARQLCIKAGQALQTEEIHQLVADLFSCKMPETSPSGKKTLILISSEKITQMF
ncbi:MAG: hypothetical protein IJ764_00775 [Bacteroidales bacterium]|nr:hypothetical protein [Bacteroidales bacterium]